MIRFEGSTRGGATPISGTADCGPAQGFGCDSGYCWLGTPRADVLCRRVGDDTLAGLGGADILGGGPGSDRLQGDARRDAMFGDLGADTLYGYDGTQRPT